VTPSSPGSTLRWLAAWAVLLACIGGLVFAVATARLFLWPPTDAPVHVDAIVATGGDPGELRSAKAISLAVAGYAPVVVISRGGNIPVRCPRAGHGVQVICFRANPLNTRGEMEFAANIAARHHWTSLMIVPGRDQATRARLLFRRCSDIHLTVVPVSGYAVNYLYSMAYAWASLAKAFVANTSC